VVVTDSIDITAPLSQVPADPHGPLPDLCTPASERMLTIIDYLLVPALALLSGLSMGYFLFSGQKSPQVNAGNRSPIDRSPTVKNAPPAAAVLDAQLVLARLREVSEQFEGDLSEHNLALRQVSADLAGDRCDVGAAVDQLLKANLRMEEKLKLAEAQLQEQACTIEIHVSESRTDSLTGLANRRAFDEAMKASVERAAKPGVRDSLIMFDVDHFKGFNDTYGHLAGDEVLRQVGTALQREARPGDKAARYGGEEFAIILSDLVGEPAKREAERLRATIGELEFCFNNQPVNVTASAGMSAFQPGDSIKCLIERADSALYEAKKAGRNRCYWHDGQQLLPVIATNPATDPLSKLPTQSTFKSNLSKILSDPDSIKESLSVMVLRVDHFEKIQNDHGSLAGRTLLQAVAQQLQNAVGPIGQLFHYGNESFAVLLPAVDLVAAAAIAEQVRASIEASSSLDDDAALALTVSVGVATHDADPSVQPMIERALKGADYGAWRQGNIVMISDGNDFEAWASSPRLVSTTTHPS